MTRVNAFSLNLLINLTLTLILVKLVVRVLNLDYNRFGYVFNVFVVPFILVGYYFLSVKLHDLSQNYFSSTKKSTLKIIFLFFSFKIKKPKNHSESNIRKAHSKSYNRGCTKKMVSDLCPSA